MQHEWQSSWMIKDCMTKLKECAALQWLGHEVCCHYFDGTTLDEKIALCNAIGDEKVVHTDVLGVPRT